MEAAGISCGACKQPMLDDDDQPRISAAHACKACNSWLHSGVLCSAVWEPIQDGNNYFCGQACVESFNQCSSPRRTPPSSRALQRKAAMQTTCRRPSCCP